MISVLKLLLALLVLGSLIYLIIRFLQRDGDGGSTQPPSRPIAPDDDPGFLRDLDDEMWRERRNQSGPDQP